MLRGTVVELRMVREADLDELFERLSDLRAKGDYFPLGVMSEPALRSEYAESGFWKPDEGMLLMIGSGNEIVGEVEFFPIASYLAGYEISYQLFGAEHAGKGYTSEAVRLLADYIFARKRVERVQLNIHPDNEASRRVAQKAGFTFEGVMRRCWFHRGEYHDLEVWSLLRDDV
ncbi:MAG TPA: GNAT family protein [Acidimicrobiia bacterium]|nr:GNAT family protein [Acidimicrobiia bacterium]